MAVARERNQQHREVSGRGGMQTASILLCALFLLSCQRSQKDPRIAENAAPHIVVRVVERAAERSCDNDNLIAALSCKLTRAPRIGCVYAETGDDIITPITRARRETFDCNVVPGAGRVVVADQPLRHVTFFNDERQERVLLQAGDAEWLFLFFDGALLDSRALRSDEEGSSSIFLADGTPDWPKVPTLLDVVPAHLARFTDADLDALTRATPEGPAKLEAAFVAAFARRDITPESDGWARLYERLSPARRDEILKEIIESIARGESDAIAWAQTMPVPRAPLIEALVTALADDDGEGSELPEAFNLLGRLAPERLAPLACHRLERAWFDTEESDLSMQTVALAVIAREKLPCPWVTPWLLRNTCSWQLRDEREDLSPPLAPLVSPVTQRRAIADELAVEALEEGEAELREYSESWGPLLLAAAQAQGALPTEFTRANTRRFYRREYAQPADDEDACRDAADEVSEWACQLPHSMHELRREGCLVTLDDQRQVMTLRRENR